MEFIVKTTNELSQIELQEILDLFNSVFDTDRSMSEMLNQYKNNPFGFSYHSMMLVDDKIVGCETFVPLYYIYAGKKVKVVNAIDNMIDKKHRDFFNLRDINKNMNKRLKDDGFVFSYGFPNDIAYPIFKKSKLMLDIGNLDTYFLPINIGGIKKGFSVLNIFSKIFSYAWVYLTLPASKKQEAIIIKDSSTFNVTRYKRMDGKYTMASHGGINFVYKIKDFEGIKSLFLIDIDVKSGNAFRKAVKYILKHEKEKYDIILYVGSLPKDVKRLGLIKMPRRFEPKHFNFMGVALDKSENIKRDFFDIRNWDVNLSNYDLI